MNLVEALPKDFMGYIILNPGGIMNGEPIEGYVDPNWLQTNFSNLANASVPLSDDDFNALKSIDDYWAQNAERWRSEGII